MSVIVIGMLALTVACYTAQSFFNKMFSINYTGPAPVATPVFSLLYGLIAGAATLCYNGFHFAPSAITWALGLAGGVTLFLYNLAMIQGARTGPYSLQCIVMLFGSILLPMFFTLIVWQDTLAWIRVFGIILALVSFVVFNCGGVKLSDVKKGYFFWIGMLFVTNGIYGILLDTQQRLMHQTQRNEMIMIIFFSSALISLVYLLRIMKGHPGKAFQMNRKTMIFVLLSSAAAAIAVNFSMLLLSKGQTAIIYTIENGGVLVASAILSAVALKEKLTHMMLLGILIAIVGLVLLGIPV